MESVEFISFSTELVLKDCELPTTKYFCCLGFKKNQMEISIAIKATIMDALKIIGKKCRGPLIWFCLRNASKIKVRHSYLSLRIEGPR